MILPDEKMQRQWPNIIMENKPLFNRYCRAAHSTGLTITNMIAEKLDVEPEEINSRHVIEEHAGDHVRMTRSPTRATEMPSIQTPSHTDFGTITILVNWLGGLQVWSESSRKAGLLEPDILGQ